MSAADATQPHYDAIVVGAGPIGAHVARELGAAGKQVLLLEAGRASGLTWESYQSYVATHHTAVVKEPNAPYPQNATAPSPITTDILKTYHGTPDLQGYQVEMGPMDFASTYLRSLGGTSLHWLGTMPRHVPNDFRMQSTYGVGVDWPVTYDDLQEWYCRSEWSLGVAADKRDQELFGTWFPDDYDYPMHRIPPSYADQLMDKATRGLTIEFDGRRYPIGVRSLAQARNGIPRTGRVNVAGEVRHGYTPKGAVGNPMMGLRCEGNASCIPICPVQAKYNALKTIAECDTRYVTLQAQTIVTKLVLRPNGRVGGVEWVTYDAEGGPVTAGGATATIVVLAAHAVENAKLLLASGAANSSDQVGRNLMDHPFFITWALANEPVGAFRGPGQTSGLETLRDGAFRSTFAASRIDMGNWGWDLATFPPGPAVSDALAQGVFGPALRRQLGETLPRQLRLGYCVEQLPQSTNRVTISREYRDANGLFRPVIHYDLSPYTWEGMVSAIRISDAVWARMGIPEEQRFWEPPRDQPNEREFRSRDGKKYLLHYFGAGHHVGTHRMGTSRTDSVVNRYQRSWDHENLYIVGCGSHPTIATANPTNTAVALALMATRDMLAQLR